MRGDSTVLRAVRSGVKIQRPMAGAKPLCRKCWTSHYRHGKNLDNCAGRYGITYTQAELDAMLARARAQRIEEDIQAYARKKEAA